MSRRFATQMVRQATVLFERENDTLNATLRPLTQELVQRSGETAAAAM